MTVPIRLEVNAQSEMEPLADEWDDLADRIGASPFDRPGWYSAWLGAFGAGRPELITLRRDGRLTGLVPLQRRLGRLSAPANWHTPAFSLLAEDSDALRALSQAMVARARPWLSLAFLDAGEPPHVSLEAAMRGTGCRVRSYVLERSPYVPLEGSWSEYEGRLPAKRRSNLRRLERRLRDRGKLTFEAHDGRAGLEALLDDGFRVEASGWKGEGGTAVTSDAVTRAFYTDVARWAAARGWLRLGFLRLDGRALAFDLAIEADGVHYLLKTGYDEEWRSAAPGVLLRRDALRRAFAGGLQSYEFLGDATEWKREWTDSVRERVALEAFNASPGGRAGWIAWAYARPAVKRLRAGSQ